MIENHFFFIWKQMSNVETEEALVTAILEEESNES